MKLTTQDTKETINVSKLIFGCKFNETLVHQVVVAYQAFKRKGNSKQKNRSEVSGSKKKPWKQKGTGRARAGTTKSPIWRSGGVTFAKKNKNYTKKINKKMYRGAMKCIFSELIRQNRIIIIKNFILDQPKTKILIKKIKKMSLKEAIIITEKKEKNLILASRNLNKIQVYNTNNINPIQLIKIEKTIIINNAIKKIEEKFQ